MNTLTHFATLKVSGADAAQFLQGQLTNDIHDLDKAHHQLSALCNRLGRVLALMDIFRIEDEYFLTLPQELLTTILPLLQKYIVFSKVNITDVSNEYSVTVNQDFLLTQMRALIPFIGMAQSGQFLPHPLGLVQLGAVSFKKGCFVGQEIIARMQHRTTNTRSLYYFEIQQSHIPAIGEAINIPDYPSAILVNTLEIHPGTHAILVILDAKMLYTTPDES
jgi:folate-binding protein YgfZ